MCLLNSDYNSACVYILYVVVYFVNMSGHVQFNSFIKQNQTSTIGKFTISLYHSNISKLPVFIK